MNYIYRVNKWNESTKDYDVLFPQTVTANVLRRDDGGVLETWLKGYDRHIVSEYPHLNHAVSHGDGHRHLLVNRDDASLVDGYPLLLRLHTNLDTEPTIDFNGSGPKYILNAAGERLSGGQAPGSSMFLLWNEKLDSWISLSQDGFGSMTKIMLPVVREYVHRVTMDGETLIVIPGFNHNEELLQLNYGQTILRYGIDYTYVHEIRNAIQISGDFSLFKDDLIHCRITKFEAVSKRGNVRYEMEMKYHHVTIETDGQTEVVIPRKAQTANFIEVNYNQTILREGLDYDFNDERNRIILKNFALMKGEVLSFRVIRLVELNGDIKPGTIGSTGSYRYSYKVEYKEYTSDRDGTILIPVPDYDQRMDELTVILDNKLLIPNADYYIDTMDQVILVHDVLDAGKTIYFTLRKGVMAESPNFYRVEAKGQSGQHLSVDITDNQLCDFFTLAIRLSHDLQAAPTVKCINGPARPIVDAYGNPIGGGYKAGSFLWVVYNEKLETWYSMSHGQYDVSGHFRQNEEAEGIANFIGRVPRTVGDTRDYGEVIIPHGLSVAPSNIQIIPIEPPETDAFGRLAVIGDIWSHADDTYIYVGNTGNATSKFRWIAQTTSANTDFKKTLTEAVEELKARPGNLFTRTVVYEAQEDGVCQIAIEDYDSTTDKIILVNYGQTILRERMDYIVDTNGVFLTNMALAQGEIIQFVLAKQPLSYDVPSESGRYVGRYYIKGDSGTFYEFDPSKFVIIDDETGEEIPLMNAVFENPYEEQ